MSVVGVEHSAWFCGDGGRRRRRRRRRSCSASASSETGQDMNLDADLRVLHPKILGAFFDALRIHLEMHDKLIANIMVGLLNEVKQKFCRGKFEFEKQKKKDEKKADDKKKRDESRARDEKEKETKDEKEEEEEPKLPPLLPSGKS